MLPRRLQSMSIVRSPSRADRLPRATAKNQSPRTVNLPGSAIGTSGGSLDSTEQAVEYQCRVATASLHVGLGIKHESLLSNCSGLITCPRLWSVSTSCSL